MFFAITRKARQRIRQGRLAVRIAVLAGLAILALIGWLTVRHELRIAEELRQQAVRMAVERHPYVTRTVEVTDGSTYGALMERAGVTGSEATAVFEAAKGAYDLSNIRLGRSIRLVFDRDTGRFRQLVYQIDSEEVLEVSRRQRFEESEWIAERKKIDYEIRVRTAEGVIETSLYESALDQGIDERAIIALADVFQWTIDFVMDVRKGDTYRFVFEERYLDGKYVMPGQVLAAKYTNVGSDRYAFYFEDSSGDWGYYDEEGNSVERLFLKAPAEFKYISSGFTTGQRYISAFNVSTGHRAIDYAAPTGTPVRTVGAGTVVFAGWGGAYGNKVSVRHNATYTTNYCHLSKISVRYGSKVDQGQTIGLVGSTGFSTGPHLHYEMVKNGTKINPLTEEFPSVEPVPEGERDRFLETVRKYRPELD
ncbi:peptidoglycan DD-metalloendopeptidase family protein [Candidatus Uhrbacteria bacterium]|nr:peptidoglycan DD-metalloendopeptidase family protein [Candidatus Uhrbacteria bacterium]